MISVRPAITRGHVNHGWLNTYHTFSFARYIDRRYMGYRVLRVINDDTVAGGSGFPTHPHDNMEIVTYVLSGALEHRDSMGNGEVIRAGELQRMSAGSGVTHSEFNASKTDPVHLYRIWLLPQKKDIEPSYEQKAFSDKEKRNKFLKVVSPDGGDGALKINQDASIYLSLLEEDTKTEFELAEGRYHWLQVLRGELTINNENVSAGDGIAIEGETSLQCSALKTSELMLFDLP